MTKAEPSAARRRILGISLCVAGLAAGVGAGLLARGLRADPLAQRRLEVSRMSPAAKQHLLRQQQRFDKLEVRERNNLRALQSEVAAAPDREKLIATMERYHEWLKSLSITQRGELLALAEDPDARLAKIDEFQREQDRRLPLQRPDVEVVMKWLDRVRSKLPEDIQSKIKFPFGSQRHRQSNRDPEDQLRDQRRRFVGYAYQRWMRPSYRPSGSDSQKTREPLPVDENDLRELGQQLSPAARKRLDNATAVADKLRLLGGWMRSIAYWGRSGGRTNMAPDVSKAELVRFFENDLTEEKREDLLRYNADELDQRLRYLYMQDKSSKSNPAGEEASPDVKGPEPGPEGPPFPDGGGSRGRRPRGRAPGAGFRPGGGKQPTPAPRPDAA